MLLSKTILSLLFLLSVSMLAIGQQRGVIYGHLRDTVGHQLLKDAYISIHHAGNNTVQKSVFSGNNGHFVCADLPMGKYYVKISFQGFESLSIPFLLNTTQMDLGDIYMLQKVRVLDTLVVLESAVVVKKDTTEFNASRFQTRDYAALSELLQLLPGIQLNSDGSLTINGQPIDQIMVDGKPFFDGNIRMALEHLPADIVRKIQVFASKSNTPMGLPPPMGLPGNKTLNILLRKDKQKGSFGKVQAGGGTGGTYTSSADLNHMNGGQQLSLIEDAGNASPENLYSVNMSGIIRQVNGGLNYRDSRNDKTSIHGNIQAGDTRNESIQRTHQVNIYADGSSVIQDNQLHAVANSNVQSASVTIDHKPNEQNTYTFQPRLTLNHGRTKSTSAGSQQNEATGDTVYTTSSQSSANNKGTTVSSLLQYAHNWLEADHTLLLGMNISGNDHRRSITALTQTNQVDTRQHNTTTDKALNIAPFANYVVPAGKNNLLNLQGNYAYSRDDMSYKVYSNKYYDAVDSSQRKDYLSTYQTAMVQFSFRRQWSKVSLQAGSGVEADWISGDNKTEQTTTSRRFINMLPAASFTMNVGENKTLNAGYTGKPINVTVQDLQPISVTSDSLFIQEGNPDLVQPYMHTMTIGYTTINTVNSRTFSATLTANATMHSIQQSLTLLDGGVQVSQPVNLDGAKDFNLMLDYSIPGMNKKSSYKFSTNAVYSATPVLSNGMRNDSRIVNISGNMNWSYMQQQGVNFSFTASPGFNAIQTDGGTSSQYFSVGANGKCSYFKGDWGASLSAYYVYNNSSYQLRYPIAVSSVSYRFLSHKQAEVKLSLSDLFNQSSGVSRNITASSISDSWTQKRGRYILCSFTYNFRKF